MEVHLAEVTDNTGQGQALPLCPCATVVGRVRVYRETLGLGAGSDARRDATLLLNGIPVAATEAVRSGNLHTHSSTI